MAESLAFAYIYSHLAGLCFAPISTFYFTTQQQLAAAETERESSFHFSVSLLAAAMEKERKLKNEVNANGVVEKGDFFDPAAPPPFKIGEIRAAIPKHCWVKNPWRSLSYVLRDLLVVLALLAAATHFNTWFFWPLYWVAQGTMFWAIFVLGHDWYAYIFQKSLSFLRPVCCIFCLFDVEKSS